MKYICLVILVFSLFSCKNQHGNNLHTIQKIENYNGKANSSVEEKLLATPEVIINSLNEMDNVSNYSSYKLNDDEKQLFLNYYDILPLKYKNIINEKVIGIYFVNNFLGGGMTEAIFDDSGNMYMVLFFNPEILHRNITEWINFRDNSIFINNENSISLIIECDSNYHALIHTLLHEASHVYDYYNNVTPFTEDFLKNSRTKFQTEFIKNVWNDYDEPIAEYNYENRKRISFYGLGEKIDIRYAVNFFAALEKTPFNSLYGSKTWAEDFAESFAWYYLNKYCDIKYVTLLMKNESVLINYDPNNSELVKGRYKILEEIIK